MPSPPVTIDRQSYLGLLTAIKGGGGDAYWTETDAQRCRGGNQQLAHKLVRKIREKRVRLGVPVTSIEQSAERVRVACADGRTLECDDVVIAVPPSTWPRIRFDPPLPAALAPQMGSNVKYLAHVKKRFWQESGTGQYAISDGVIGWTWDGTDGQAGEADACLTAFSGGLGAETARAWSAADRDAHYRAEYEKLHPQYGEHFVASRFMNWPAEPWTGASYSFPAPGEVLATGPLLYNGLAGRVHFAGEHCSYAFVGYMEGALNSGAALARRLAQRDGALRA